MAGTNEIETTAVPSTLAEARDLILQHEARANAEHYRIGCLFNHVVDKGLAGAWTAESARGYLGSRIKAFSPSTLAEYGEVAREFPEAVCRKYGMHPLRLLMSYAKRHHVSLSGKDPGLMLIRVPCEDGTELRKPFAECTREELGRALSGVAPKARGFEPPSRAHLRCLQILRDGLRKRFAERPSPCAMARVREGRIQLTLKKVWVEDLERLVGAIIESLEPLHEEMYRRPVAQPPVLKAVPSPSRVGAPSHAATALRAP